MVPTTARAEPRRPDRALQRSWVEPARSGHAHIGGESSIPERPLECRVRNGAVLPDAIPGREQPSSARLACKAVPFLWNQVGLHRDAVLDTVHRLLAHAV